MRFSRIRLSQQLRGLPPFTDSADQAYKIHQVQLAVEPGRRQFPVFGRPVHHGLAPFDYGPAVLRMPFGFRLAADTLPSGWSRPVGSLRSADLGISCTVCSSFPKLCPLGFFLIR